MPIVADASVLVAALVDSGPDGEWASHVLSGETLSAPHMLPAEVANVLRRVERQGLLSRLESEAAYDNCLSLAVDYYAYELFAERVWELRDNVTAYDAWYIALAEALECRLATLDQRLARASGIRCQVVVP